LGSENGAIFGLAGKAARGYNPVVAVADVRMAEKVFILLEEAQRTGWQCNLEAVWLALIVSQTQASWPSYVVLLYSIQPKGEERPLWWKGYRLTLIGGELDDM